MDGRRKPQQWADLGIFERVMLVFLVVMGVGVIAMAVTFIAALWSM